jgi:hypothetical protein
MIRAERQKAKGFYFSYLPENKSKYTGVSSSDMRSGGYSNTAGGNGNSSYQGFGSESASGFGSESRGTTETNIATSYDRKNSGGYSDKNYDSLPEPTGSI